MGGDTVADTDDNDNGTKHTQQVNNCGISVAKKGYHKIRSHANQTEGNAYAHKADVSHGVIGAATDFFVVILGVQIGHPGGKHVVQRYKGYGFCHVDNFGSLFIETVFGVVFCDNTDEGLIQNRVNRCGNGGNKVNKGLLEMFPGS